MRATFMFPKERKMNIKLDKLLVEKFLVVAISIVSSAAVIWVVTQPISTMSSIPVTTANRV